MDVESHATHCESPSNRWLAEPPAGSRSVATPVSSMPPRMFEYLLMSMEKNWVDT
jgi:hypothetical protein